MHAALTFFMEINSLKRWFVEFAKLNKKYEGYKIWARWLITHMSLRKQQNVCLPTNGIDNDLQIVVELTSKGCTLSHANTHYRAFISQVKQLVKLYERNADTCIYTIPLKINNDANGNIVLSAGKIKHSISPVLKTKLETLYRKTNKGLNNYLHHHIWYLCTHYSILDGKSLQWAVPKNVLRYFNTVFGCNTELFASPLNSYYSKYFSLYDIDRKFGSLGSFFDADPSYFKQGCFQINPPFIDVLFTETSTRILGYLETAELNDRDLTFIYIMPDWDELFGYKVLFTSKYCIRNIKINSGEHYYYQAVNDTYVKVYFSTNVLILSTNTDICSDFKARRIANGFKNPFREI